MGGSSAVSVDEVVLLVAYSCALLGFSNHSHNVEVVNGNGSIMELSSAATDMSVFNFFMWVHTCAYVCGPPFSGSEVDAGSRFGIDSSQELNTEQSPCSERRTTLSKW